MNWNVGNLLLQIGLMISVRAQKWPLSGSCEPCKCAISDEGQEPVRYVTCFNLSLTDFPLSVPENTDVLDFSNNKLQSDRVQDIFVFPFLQYLSLANNDITTLDDSPFSNLALLTYLKMNGNSIKKLTKKSFIGLKNLNTLQGLKVDTTESQAFVHMPELRVLELEITEGEIPEKLFDGIKLHSLNLTLLKASELPSNLFAFGSKTLKYLSVRAPGVRHLHENLLRSLTHLRSIHLELPQLVDMPPHLFNIKSVNNKSSNLQEIQLHEVQNIPTDLFSKQDQLLTLGITKAEELSKNLFDNLVSLQVLELTQTFISIIPKNWFAKINNLILLSLKETSLRRLDAISFAGLTQLKTLDLSLNSLRVIPKDVFIPLQNSLERLDLSGNILKSIELGALDGMSSLKTLELNDNKMASLQNGLFNHLVRLSSLNLQENKLSSLPDKIFSNQKRLSILNLASNSFSDLPQATLQVSKELISLDLSHNQIHMFGVCTANKFPNLEFLSLKSNPLHCDCNLLLLKESQPNLNIEGICTSPTEFENQHIAKTSMPNRCFSEICDLDEAALPIEPTPTKHLLGNDPVINTKPFTASDMSKIMYTSTVAYPDSNSADILPSTPAVNDQSKHVHGASTVDTNMKSQQVIDKLLPSGGGSSSPSGATAEASVYNSTEFRSVIGVVAGCLFVLLCGVLVYLRQKHERETRFTLRQRSNEVSG